MAQVARWIARVLRGGEAVVPSVRQEVEALMANYPLYT
jgi:glycine/serine hydroxymethyltransferase